MFEFDDSKFGKIKVVNITDARSSMASIMNDRTCSYVITKNNRPIRVVVNFETFRRLQGTPSRSSKTQDQKENKDTIKGLIQTRDKDIKSRRQPAMGGLLEPSTQTKEVKTKEIVKTEEVVQKPAPPPPPPTQEPKEPPPTDDYFQRFKKLYNAPRHGPLFQKEPNKKEAVSQRPRAHQTEAPQTRVPTPESLPEPPEAEGLSKERPSPSMGVAKKGEPPSIQDLLNELENEKLSGEDEAESEESVEDLLSRAKT